MLVEHWPQPSAAAEPSHGTLGALEWCPSSGVRAAAPSALGSTWAQAWLLLGSTPMSSLVMLYRFRMTDGITPRWKAALCPRDSIPSLAQALLTTLLSAGNRCRPPTGPQTGRRCQGTVLWQDTALLPLLALAGSRARGAPIAHCAPCPPGLPLPHCCAATTAQHVVLSSCQWLRCSGFLVGGALTPPRQRHSQTPAQPRPPAQPALSTQCQECQWEALRSPPASLGGGRDTAREALCSVRCGGPILAKQCSASHLHL